MRRLKTERFIPNGAKEEKFEDVKCNVYRYTNLKNEFCVIIYGGKRSKPDVYYRFSNVEQREKYISDFIENKRNVKAIKEKMKKERKEKEEKTFKNIKVGDIFCCSWGYEQTNLDFYQLVELRGKKGTFREINKEEDTTKRGMDCGYFKPIKDSFKKNGNTITKIIKGDSFSLYSFARAYKCNPDDYHYCSWYY